RPTARLNFADLPQDLQEQVSGKINWFSPYGTFPEDPNKPAEDPTAVTPKGGEPKEKVGVGEPKGPRVQPVGPGPGQRPGSFGEAPRLGDAKYSYKAPGTLPTNPKALVRFLDVDVEPEATYQYRIQVRMANPNYKQPTKLVAHSGLTRLKELVSDWVETPRKTVPSDYQFYITNQERGVVTNAAGKQSIDRTSNQSADADSE